MSAPAVTADSISATHTFLGTQTVGLKRFRLARDERGRWGLWRIYAFEFTVTGGERYQGETRLRGERVHSVVLPPHRF